MFSISTCIASDEKSLLSVPVTNFSTPSDIVSDEKSFLFAWESKFSISTRIVSDPDAKLSLSVSETKISISKSYIVSGSKLLLFVPEAKFSVIVSIGSQSSVSARKTKSSIDSEFSSTKRHTNNTKPNKRVMATITSKIIDEQIRHTISYNRLN